MEAGQEVSYEEVLLQKGKLLDDYAAVKAKLQMLKDAARAEAEVLNGLVEYLKSGRDCGQVAISLTLESYLTGTLANLIRGHVGRVHRDGRAGAKTFGSRYLPSLIDRSRRLATKDKGKV